MAREQQWEPSAEQVEAEAAGLRADSCNGMMMVGYDALGGSTKDVWRRVAKRTLRRQHEREAGLLEALRRVLNHNGPHWYSVNNDVKEVAARALAAHAKLDAKPVPTLLEAATAYVQARHNTDDTNGEALRALKAAVEREERGK